ncbi:MAG: tripartite tricarboxylate transporter substrate binding protein [Alphaproteobacteria bacterium]|nr:tripartite tricarboxylate transporter substrate binding protein [Alphaproteobacteria bacterium]
MVRISRRRVLAQAGLAAAGVGLAADTYAQPSSFPTQPIRILVGFAAGGGNDVIARLVAQQMSGGPLGQVIVDNKTGASGLIAADMLAKARPDGTTLMVAAQTSYAVAPQLYKSIGFDAPRDVAGISLLGASPLVLVVNPSFAAKSVGDLLAIAEAQPGAINYGSGGVGTTPHMAAELFLHQTGIRMTHVPYRGEAPAIADVVAGQLPLLFANVSVVTGQVKGGALRALAVTSPQRAPSLPDVPTLAEPGIKGADVETWFGLTAPAATPRDIIDRLNTEVRKALAAPDLQRRFTELSLSVTPCSPQELDALIKSEAVRWGEVIRRANIRAPE